MRMSMEIQFIKQKESSLRGCDGQESTVIFVQYSLAGKTWNPESRQNPLPRVSPLTRPPAPSEEGAGGHLGQVESA